MNHRSALSITFLAVVLWLSCSLAAHARQADKLLGSGATTDSESIGLAPDSADSDTYAQGTRAIDDGRWTDAVTLFSQIANTAGEHSDGALYWRAYAQNKLGQSNAALETCGILHRDYAASKWVEECGALEIEIHAKSGRPVQPEAKQSDDLKLLALATLMQHDEKRALADINEILNSSDSSEKLKQGALYILGERHTDTVYPQIVRLSLAQGDVRVARGIEDKHNKTTTWEKAETDLPLESGYSLVTGNDGRAEIEFENASTMYLAENSVLVFNRLTTTAGVPNTEVALLSGAATLHVRPYVAGEVFLLRTPTDNLATKYPGATNFRVNSYTDGVAITPLSRGALNFTASARQEELTAGKTLYFKEGLPIMLAGPFHQPDFSAWDQWVETRYSARQKLMNEALQASGLSTPLPGMADMQGQGHYFPCEPYGTCWEPSSSAGPQVAENIVPQSGSEQSSAAEPGTATSAATQGKSPRKIGFIGKPSPGGTGNSPSSSPYADMAAFWPCVPVEVRAMYSQSMMPDIYQQLQMNPWAWTACHSGEWLYQGNRYVWVVGRRHHHPPYHWVKSGNKVVLIPSHPHDVEKHLPVNRTKPALALDPNNPHSILRLELEKEASVTLMKEPPREFRNVSVRPLAPAAEPRMVAYRFQEAAVAKGEPVKAGTPITFNPRTQSFMMTQQEMHGNKSVAISVPMGNHSGDLQGHSGFGGGSGVAARSGGSGGSSGGVSHSSASAPSSSSTSSSSSVSTSSASSSGGAHH